MKRVAVMLVVIVLALSASIASASSLYDVNADTQIRSTVLFVGDSIITKGAAEITATLTNRMDGAHLPVFGSRGGMGIRGYGPANCPPATYPAGCDASNYWQVRIPKILATVTPSAVVIDLGANDVPLAGTATGLGYTNYAAKIDYLLAQLPSVPVIWTNLPCAIWPAPYNGTGCSIINNALAAAVSRHPNLTVLGWYAASKGHPEYIGASPHYTDAGYTAWAKLVNSTLNSDFPQS